jgi:HK97 family phage prohead protease
MPDLVHLAYDARIDDVDGDERTVVAVITTDAIDRHKEVVLPGGIDTAAYRKNPVVLWSHNSSFGHDLPPIGKCLWIKPTGDKRGLVAKTQFARDDFSQNIFDLFREGILRGFSIGFQPVVEDMSPPTTKELRERPEWAAVRCIYRKSSLLEYSAVSIPANPEALALAVSKGLVCDQLKAMLPTPPLPVPEAPADAHESTPPPRPELPPLTGRTFGEVCRSFLASEEAKYKALVSGAIRDSEDLARGRI